MRATALGLLMWGMCLPAAELPGRYFRLMEAGLAKLETAQLP